jgi:hypothetical protein
VSEDALDQKYQSTKSQNPDVRMKKIKVTPEKLDKIRVEHQRLQDNFMALVLMRKTLREFLNLITEDMLYTQQATELLDFLKSNMDFDGKTTEGLVQNLLDYVKIESLLYEELYQGLELNELHDEAARLQARLIEIFVKTQKTKLSEELQTADQSASRTILTKVKEYDELLNKVKGAVHAKS